MKVFVVSYPRHARISQISAFYALKNLKGVTEVIYLWDDFHHGYESHPFTDHQVIKFSEFKHVEKAATGWYRQQFVKMQLHHVIDDESFFILDGDTLLRNPLDLGPDKMLKTIGYNRHYFDFMQHSYKLEKRNNFSFIAPLLRFEREVLVKLEEYSISMNNLDVPETFIEYSKLISKMKISIKDNLFSEAELYGTFATQILGRKYEYILSPFTVANHVDKPTFEDLCFSTNDDIVLCGPEYQFSKKFWRKHQKIMSKG